MKNKVLIFVVSVFSWFIFSAEGCLDGNINGTPGPVLPDPPCEKPVLAYPLNGDTSVSIETVLIWDSQCTFNAHIQISKYSSFDQMVFDSLNWGGTQQQITLGILEHNTVYYWRVKSSGLFQQWSDWSTIQWFKTISN
jgi:hypothetical protein